MPTECDVSILNGVDIGTTLQSDKSCHAILDYKEAKSAVEGNSEAENKFKGVVVTDSRKSDV